MPVTWASRLEDLDSIGFDREPRDQGPAACAISARATADRTAAHAAAADTAARRCASIAARHRTQPPNAFCSTRGLRAGPCTGAGGNRYIASLHFGALS